VQPSFDKGFNQTIRYDVPLLEGYCHRFMRNLSPRPGLGFSGQLNPEIVADLRRGEFDALVVHGYAALTNLFALLSPRSAKTRVLLRAESHLHEPRSLATRFAKKPLLQILFRQIDHFLAIGSLNTLYYKEYGVGPDRITLAPYSVDNDHFAAGAAAVRKDREGLRARLGLPAQVPLFLFCGKLIPEKRPLDVVRALADVRRSLKCALAVVGSGALEQEVRAEIERLRLNRDVFLMGFRNQGELPEIYAACDALILPSEHEPWGLVVNECMAAGLAIAVSDRVGAGPDLVSGNGFIYPVGDVRALAGGLIRIASDARTLHNLQVRSLERISSWGIPQTVEGFVNGVQGALKR
jgi:glycosyltransferase involved in cell wall biosynthesis